MRAHYSHPAIAEFAAVASAFCEAVANVAARTPDAQLDLIHRLLPQAYSAALLLPDTSVLFADGGETGELEPPEAQPEVAPPAGLAQLSEFLGLRRFYREIFDPYAEPADGEVTGDIIDDLDDIYRDLLRGLVHWQNGRPGEALLQWRFHFQCHWAEHATSALRAIFALSAWRDIPWPAGAA